MPWQPRFTIGGLMGLVAASSLVAGVVAAEVRSGDRWTEGQQFGVAVVLMPLVLVLDTLLLVRRAGRGRPPYGPGWSERRFTRGFWLVGACLWLPFLGFTGGNLGAVVLLPLTTMLAGSVVLVPLHWLFPQRLSGDILLVALASTLLVMGLTRLVARGRVVLAGGLALVVAGGSALVVRSYFSD